MSAHWIANARMYAVTPEAEAAWQALIARIADDAAVPLTYTRHPAPAPLEPLWRRTDVGFVQMCGFPLALGLADVEPLVAPVPALPWADGRAVYRTDLIVRADSPWRTMSDAFAGTLGWTVAHSQSGFNALRHHLLPHWRGRPLFSAVRGNLVTARAVLDAVRTGEIDLGPLDAYWHALLHRHAPALTEGVRVLESTATAPMPAFVAAAAMPVEPRARLAAAAASAHTRPWFPPLAEALLLARLDPVDRATYAPTLAQQRAALAAGYPEPA
jgi:ABC-type phosphate/phosphonate transport system substrate-binding protein